MRTEQIIAQLASDIRPVSRHAAIARLWVALLMGAAVAFGLLLMGPGLRPDIREASATLPFWMKWTFTLSLVGSGLTVTRRLGNPAARLGLAWLGLAVPIFIVAMMALVESAQASAPTLAELALGTSASRCFVAIVTLSIPCFAGFAWAFRRLAPVRLRAAGAALGVVSGAAGAAIYAFACQETAAMFMLTWYSSGIAATGLLGALAGPKLLRW